MKPDLTGFPKGYKRPNVLFTVAEFRSLEDDMHMGKISYSRMIEIINEKANEYAKQNLLNKPDVRQSLPDIRNKLTPMKNLCALLDRVDLSNNADAVIKIIRKEIEQCKENIEYLSGNVA